MKPLSASLTVGERGHKPSTSSLQRVRIATILLVSSFTAVVLLATSFNLYRQYNAAMENTVRAARNTVRTIESHASQTLGETYRIMEGIADVYEHERAAGTVSEEYLHKLMAEKLALAPAVRAFFISDANFVGIAGSRTYPVDISRVYLTGISFEAMTDVGGDMVIGDIYRNQTQTTTVPGAWLLPVGVKIRDADNALIGYVFGLIGVEFFADYYAGLDVGPHGRAFLWTMDDRLVAGSPNVQFPTGTHRPNRVNLPKTWVPGPAQVVTIGEGLLAREIIARGKLLELPLTTSVSLDGEDFLIGWRNARAMTMLMVPLIITMMVLFGIIILRQVRRIELNEAALQQAKAAAEEANDAKSRFLAHMSHEFRTPLNAIMGFSEIIKNKVLGDAISPAYTSYADHIHRSGEHLLHIVNDILDMAKIESGVQPLTREAIDMTGVVAAATSFVEGLASQRGIKLRVTATSDLPLVSGDQRFCRQVVINLLSNAIKFSPAGADITVATRYVPGRFLDVRVIDRGPGIEPALLKRLGEPFLQGNPSVSHIGQGTGLGLSICKRYMALLGGELLIDSTVGSGTTATIRFPEPLLIIASKRSTAAE